MQERRATLRVPVRGRTQYCPAEDFLPRGGQLMNLSERGAGLMAKKAHQVGERITLSVQLPGESSDPMIATGVVRWCGSSRSRGRWWPLGLEWLPMEETTRHRLHRFLYTAANRPRAAQPAPHGAADPAVRYTLIGLGAFAATLAALGVLALHRHDQELQALAAQRQAVIAQLQRREASLTSQLTDARQHLEETTGEVARLDQYAIALSGAMERLRQDVNSVQTSYVDLQQSYSTVRQERELLMQRVMDLEQERARLATRLASVQELRVAIQEAIQRRKEQDQATRLLEQEAQHAADAEQLSHGNRGYLVRGGRPTATGSTVWIRIHEPEAAPLITAPALPDGARPVLPLSPDAAPSGADAPVQDP